MARGITFRANRLIIIAGPPAAGKTTLLSRIREGTLPALCEQVGLQDPLTWTYLNATDLTRVERSSIDRLVVHYDLLAQRTPNGFRNVSELIGRAGQVVLLTLWTDPESLRRRSRVRLVEGVSAVVRNPVRARQSLRRLRRIWRRDRVFRNDARVAQLYSDWFEFSSRYPVASHWLFDSSVPGSTVAETLEAAQRGMLVPTKRP